MIWIWCKQDFSLDASAGGSGENDELIAKATEVFQNGNKQFELRQEAALNELHAYYNDSKARGVSLFEYNIGVAALVQRLFEEALQGAKDYAAELERTLGVRVDMIIQAAVTNNYPPPLDLIKDQLSSSYTKMANAFELFKVEAATLSQNYNS